MTWNMSDGSDPCVSETVLQTDWTREVVGCTGGVWVAAEMIGEQRPECRVEIALELASARHRQALGAANAGLKARPESRDRSVGGLRR